jgi:hypothetical protein
MNKNEVSCSIFESISGSNGGTILSIANSKLHFFKCKFYNITSSSFPGCFNVTKSTFSLKLCSFSGCHAAGSNRCFGKIANILDSTVAISHFSAYLCGPLLSDVGDSIIVFTNCKVETNYYNATNCYGSDGGAISFYSNPCENSLYYLNIVDCIDHNSFETTGSSYSTVVYQSNFLNSSKNSACVICANGAPCKFVSCVFTKKHSLFISGNSAVTFVDCITDTSDSGFTYEKNPSTVLFEVFVPCDCRIITPNTNYNILNTNIYSLILFIT